MDASIAIVIGLLLTAAAGGAGGAGPVVVDTEQDEVQWPPKNTKGWRDFNRLVHAVDRDDVATVRLLVQRGVSVDGKDAGDDWAPSERPLFRAARRGNLAIVELLLKAGTTPDWCCCSCVTALHEAILHRHANVVRRLLEAGSDPNIPYDGSTPTLDLAKQSRSTEILQMVEKRLADRREPDEIVPKGQRRRTSR
jgi:hypothetical protein